MELIEFDEQTNIIAENQEQYLDLPAHVDSEGTVTCCWKPSWKERFQILFGKEVWHQVLTFNKPLQPQRLTLEKPDMT